MGWEQSGARRTLGVIHGHCARLQHESTRPSNFPENPKILKRYEVSNVDISFVNRDGGACVHMCVHIYMCVSTFVSGIYSPLHRHGEAWSGCLTSCSLVLTSYTESGSLSWTQSSPIIQSSRSVLPQASTAPASEWQVEPHPLSFYMGSGNLNSCPQTCPARALSTESPPQPNIIFLKKHWISQRKLVYFENSTQPLPQCSSLTATCLSSL